MFMVQKQLRNGQRYGLVCFKHAVDVDGLLMKLCQIRMAEASLRVFVAFDRRNEGNRFPHVREVDEGSYKRRTTEGVNGNNIRFNTCDNRRFIDVLSGLCEEVGINKVEAKLLGGLKVLIAFENMETAVNIMNNVNHEIRRWLHKLRRWNSSYSPSGRMTWLNIIGVPISCWDESILKRIMGLHGIIAETQNCSLEGNQNLKCGKVLIYTTAKDLINESLTINYKGNSFEIKVIEEVMDILFVYIEENNEVNQAKNKLQMGEDSKGMDILDGDGGESGEESNGDDDSLDEEETGDENNKCGGGFWPPKIARRNIREEG
ncbi:transposon TX1 [Tanacetum coccineum]